jgi:argininosuccinate lyase
MAKIWDKGYQLDPVVEQFTVGDDHVLDVFLAEHDILGSIAHARMLASIGILSDEERASITGALKDLLETARAGEFTISPQQEDVHTAVEEALVEKLGDTGKKVHTGRSRNDQVLLDTRMYTRERLLAVWKETAVTAGKLLDFARKHEFVPMPGRTHTQRAMPSSVGTWAGAFAESLVDDIEMLECAYRLINQCPLGSAASYGVKLPRLTGRW